MRSEEIFNALFLLFKAVAMPKYILHEMSDVHHTEERMACPRLKTTTRIDVEKLVVRIGIWAETHALPTLRLADTNEGCGFWLARKGCKEREWRYGTLSNSCMNLSSGRTSPGRALYFSKSFLSSCHVPSCLEVTLWRTQCR